MATVIRDMQESDLEVVFSIEKNTHVSPWGKKIFRECLLVGYDCRVIEWHNEEQVLVVGYAIVRCSYSTAHLLNICIDRALQCKGYGRQLLQTLINSYSKAKHMNEMMLEVRPSNKRAICLYQSLGFLSVDIKKGYYSDGDQVEDAIVFVKML